ncbi:MAG: metallophosphoesterase [Planctomycetes bacterium]|nr:metallophosphoesterase [Planctomycetota bacterium]
MVNNPQPNPWSFVHINDTQAGSPRSYRYKPALLENEQTAFAQIKKINPDFMLFGGDLTRDGVLHDFEYEEMHERLTRLGVPYHAIPGNTDVGNKHTDKQGAFANRRDIECNMEAGRLEKFASVFGEFPWTFVHKGVRFTGYYEAVVGTGLPQEAKLWAFLEHLSTLPHERDHVVVNHYAMFIDDMNEPNFDITDNEQYLGWYFGISLPHRARLFDLMKRAGVTMVFSGHIHCRCSQVVDGVRLYKTASTGFPQWVDHFPGGDGTLGFYRCDVTESGITQVFVPLEKISTDARSYGPGGHPTPEMRDYSLAWVK